MSATVPTGGPFKLSAAKAVADSDAASSHPAWPAWLLLGAGVFLGCFWLIFGLLSALGTKVWWYYPVVLAPGAAMLILVLMARRAPVPFGTALAVAGLLPLILAWVRGGAWLGALLLGVPLTAVGVAFVIMRAQFALRRER
ncbi:MAG: hypothetical protein AB1439_04570 [candidate division FCPU426 bacterium]